MRAPKILYIIVAVKYLYFLC